MPLASTHAWNGSVFARACSSASEAMFQRSQFSFQPPESVTWPGICSGMVLPDSGICGQAPSDYPEFAAFLVECGIDSISLNPDSLLETMLAIVDTEKSLAGGGAADAAVVRRMTDSIRHRGPDDVGYLVSGPVAFPAFSSVKSAFVPSSARPFATIASA